MTIDQEFSEQQVFDIISAALDKVENSSVIPLSFSDSTLLEKLYHILPKYVGTYSDSAYIISCLRDEMYTNMSHLSAQQLHTITKNCTKCPNAVDSASIPLWNISDPDLLIVIENPYIMKNQMMVDLLVKSLTSAGFSSNRVGLTYATRCSFPPKVLAPADFANCANYLYHEIHILRPKLTIAFGGTVYGILTGDKNVKIKDIKGSITWLGSFPVMAQYTLGYIAHLGDDVSSAIPYLEQDLRKAYSFCYGD